jgi:flagellar M-ring protein FliF
MLTLRRGLSLSQQQVLSIRQLVSTAVPGLVDGHITITDQQGKLLSDSTPSEGSMLGQTPRQQEMRRAIEDELTRKAQDMLDQSIGPGRTIARVSADIDYRRIERHQETFNSDGRVVIRESISSEKSSDPVPAAGRDMAQVAVGDPARVSLEQTAGNSRRENVETEYRVPSGRETMIDSGGAISRLSVSVSVARGAQPRDAAALAQIERMVRSAVGLVKTAERQDVIEVLEMDFPVVANSPVDSQWPLLDRIPFDPMSALRVLAGLALILALYQFSRKAVIRLSVEHAPAGVPISQLTGGNARALMGGKSAEEGSDLDHIASLAEQNPSAVATWIDQTVRGSR